MLQRDYLMRMIAQAVAALARALRLRRDGELEAALEQIGLAYDGVLKFDRSMLRALDTATLVAMLGEPERARMVGRIAALEGELREQGGDGAAARSCYRRAAQLYGAVGIGDDPEDQRVAASLAGRLQRRS